MTTRYMWSELKKLVIIDQRINKLKKQFAALRKKQKTEQAKLPELETVIADLATKSRNAQKLIDKYELDLKQLKTEEEQKKDLLEKTTRPKEYMALEKELAALETSVSEREEKLIKLWDERDALVDQHTTQEAALTEEKARLKDLVVSIEKEKDEIEKQLPALEAKWNEQSKHVPPELCKSYAEIRDRVDNPIVPIVSNSCSICFNALLYQDLSALSKQSIIRCRGCYRFLFLSEDVESTKDTKEKS